MSKITTNDCKQFLVDYVTQNPMVIMEVFLRPQEIRNNEECPYLEECKNVKNWKRESKTKPDLDEHYYAQINGQHKTIPHNQIACVRRFDMPQADGQIAFYVLELKTGELLLGEYVGD